MAKHGGGFQGGIPGNMQNFMRQAQRMQKAYEESQRELEEKEFEGSAGGGAVTAKITGKKQLASITLSKDVVDPEDVEMLQDLIVASVNEAIRKVEEVEEKLSQNMGSMPF